MLKKILTYLKYPGLVLVVAAFVVGVIWANKQMDDRKCVDVLVYIENIDSTTFVTEAHIINMLNTSGMNPEGLHVDSVNTDKIEKMLNASEYLENAECVLLTDNNVRIDVKQIVPVLRVFDGDEAYYLNRAGKRMNSVGNFHADVPIVSGHFTSPQEPLKVLPIAEYVKGNESLSNLVTMYSVCDTNNIRIVPCVYGHIINFGNNSNIENKFAKLAQFYREVMPVKGWETYDTIYLKWDYRVVAHRRVKKVKKVIEYNIEEDEQAPTDSMFNQVEPQDSTLKQ